MAESLAPDEIRKRYGHLPYITPYREIIALTDCTGEVVELHEFHARGKCNGGAAWEVHHYPRTSPLVIGASREGARNIFLCRVGRARLELTPGVAGAGLEEVRITGGEVELTYAGLAGGGVAATLCRGMAGNVIGAVIHEQGGGSSVGRATLRVPAYRKLVIGADDTDNADEGATWSTMNEIAFEVENDGLCSYLGHTIVQLYPDNPYRTTNCCSTAIIVGVKDELSAGLFGRVCDLLGQRCFSDQCGLARFDGIRVPEPLEDFAGEAKAGMVTMERAQSVASESNVSLKAVTGTRGCIGALAAIGAHRDPDAAVLLPDERIRGRSGET